jgi:hypothetical protein
MTLHWGGGASGIVWIKWKLSGITGKINREEEWEVGGVLLLFFLFDYISSSSVSPRFHIYFPAFRRRWTHTRINTLYSIKEFFYILHLTVYIERRFVGSSLIPTHSYYLHVHQIIPPYSFDTSSSSCTCIDVPFLTPPWRLMYTSSLYNHCVVFISFVDFRFSIESALFYIHWLICRGCFFSFSFG